MTEPNDNLPPSSSASSTPTGGGAPPHPYNETQTPPPDAPTTPATPAPPLGYQTPGTGGPLPYNGPAPTPDDRMMGMLAHLLGIFTFFVGPLVIWLVKKDQSPFVDDQGKEALNFQITLAIGWVIAGVTTFICIGPIIGLALGVVAIVFGILGALAANKGEAYRYPLNIRLIK